MERLAKETGDVNRLRRPVDERPRSVYEIMTRQMLEDMKDDLNEVKSRVNALLWLVAGAVIVEVVTKLAG